MNIFYMSVTHTCTSCDVLRVQLANRRLDDDSAHCNWTFFPRLHTQTLRDVHTFGPFFASPRSFKSERKQRYTPSVLSNATSCHAVHGHESLGIKDLGNCSAKDRHTGTQRQLCQVVWLLLNNTLLLQMGTTYKRRFEEFENISDDMLIVDQWRKDQQDEWNRLSTTVSLVSPAHRHPF